MCRIGRRDINGGIAVRQRIIWRRRTRIDTCSFGVHRVKGKPDIDVVRVRAGIFQLIGDTVAVSDQSDGLREKQPVSEIISGRSSVFIRGNRGCFRNAAAVI